VPADIFCNASEWLANRGVTLGCTAGQYCPSQNVTRAAMALFMQRLGDALTPQYAQSAQSFNGDFEAERHLCQSPPFLVTGGPRTAFVHSFSHVVNPSATLLLQTKVAYSVDGGATWTDIPGFGFETTSQPGTSSAVSDGGILDLQVGASYLFSHRFVRFGGTAGVTAVVQCELFAQIGNGRAAASAPYDTPPQNYPRPRSR
jgi:hypothetical protein